MTTDKKPGYFDLSQASDELRYGSFGAGEKTVAGLKLLGKGLFNAVKFTATEALPAAVQQTAKNTANIANEKLQDKGLSDGQRAKYEGIRDRAEQHINKK